MDRKQLKTAAKAQIKGKIGSLFLVTLLVAFVSGFSSGVLSLIPLVGPLVASIVIVPALSLGLVRVYLNVYDGHTVDLADAFSGFDDFWSAFKVQFLGGLITFLWSLLFIIPGIIKGISISMAMMILAENKGKCALDCLYESEEMMDGHKMEYFLLSLSFLGWGLVCLLTLGIALIWVEPYMQMTIVNFYRAIQQENSLPPQEPADGEISA